MTDPNSDRRAPNPPFGLVPFFPKKDAKRLFRRATSDLGADTVSAIWRLFEGRAKLHTVYDWDRRAVPQWAWEHLASLLEARGRALLERAAQCRAPPYIAPGKAAGGQIGKYWHRVRTKEKPSNEAGLSNQNDSTD